MFDQSAIQELTKAQAIASANKAITDQLESLVALPTDYQLHDLEPYLTYRRRARGVMLTSSLQDFAAYTQACAEEGASVFVSAEEMTATAVLNLGTPIEPGHADSRAKLELRKTAAYQALVQHAGGRALSQTVAAEFLEDWIDQVYCFNEAGEVKAHYALAAIRKLTIESMRKLESSEQSLGASRSAFESVQATSAAPIPTMIRFRCEPYYGLAERTFVLRLGVQTGGDKPAIMLRIIKAEQHAQEMAAELAELVRHELSASVMVLLGAYTSKA